MHSEIRIVDAATMPRFRPDEAEYTCQKCAWFYDKTMYDGYGQCRRHATQPRLDFYKGAFPCVRPDDWCGDFALIIPYPRKACAK